MPLTASGFKDDRHDLITVTPGNPAAGDPLIWPCPDNRVVHVVAACCVFTTDANVADRVMIVQLEDATAFPVHSPSAYVQPASLARFYYWTVGIASIDHSAVNGQLYTPLSCAMILKTGENLYIAGPLFADTLISPCIRYYEWNED